MESSSTSKAGTSRSVMLTCVTSGKGSFTLVHILLFSVRSHRPCPLVSQGGPSTETGLAPIFDIAKSKSGKIGAQQRLRVNREQVAMCVLDGHPWVL